MESKFLDFEWDWAFYYMMLGIIIGVVGIVIAVAIENTYFGGICQSLR